MIKKILRKFFKADSREPFFVDEKIVNKFIEDVNFPYLISFPRTGSNWLRLVMELYFEKPSLVHVFYYKDAKDFTCRHTHDVKLTTERKNVIYLFRDPVDTVYSQLNYDKLNTDNEIFIKYWANIYGLHLEKWLLKENFTEKKTIITYEGMKKNMANEFKKICHHLNKPFDENKLKMVLEKVSKEELKKKTLHDPQVVNLSQEYDQKRKTFREKYSDLIMKCIHNQNIELKNF